MSGSTKVMYLFTLKSLLQALTVAIETEDELTRVCLARYFVGHEQIVGGAVTSETAQCVRTVLTANVQVAFIDVCTSNTYTRFRLYQYDQSKLTSLYINAAQRGLLQSHLENIMSQTTTVQMF